MENATQQKISGLRSAIRDLLKLEEVDFSRILGLATELAKLDPDNVRFFADAGIVSRLGYELVARQETAVAELVKNAYDADAASVTLIFSQAENPGGTLEIHDDGVGMTRETLSEGFMRLSSTLKVNEPVSPRFGRRRAGRKGIGRFAVQRLGGRVTVTTQTRDAPKALRISIDWTRFENGLDLSAVSSRIEEIEKERIEGTTLLIEELRDGWSDAQLKRVFRYVSDLLQPFPLSAKFQKHESDPGFKVEVLRSSGGDLAIVADEETEVLEHAAAVIEGVVDGEGRGYWSIRSDKVPSLDEPIIPLGSDPDDPVKPFAHLRDVHLRAYYFIYQVGLIPRSLDKRIRELATERGGIRVYRNGFRVSPYGDPGDDWLNIDYAEAKRIVLAPFGNKNFIGFAEIDDPDGHRFEETSSREGLIENDAFRELRAFGSRVLRAAVFRVASARQRKLIAPGRESQIERPPAERIREATERLLQAAHSVPDQEGSAAPVSKFSQLISEQAQGIVEGLEELEKSRQALLDELGMLRVLASLGIVISEFTHEIRTLLAAVEGDAKLLNESITEPTLSEASEDLLGNVRQFRAYASYFDRTVREKADRDLKPIELGELVERFVRVMRPAAARRGTQVAVEISGADLFTRPMHPSEWSSVLFNFFSNANKAIRRASVPGRILIRTGREGERIYLDFSDDGDGVAPEHTDHIFDPFFTTSTQGVFGNLDIDEELQGTGLGLKIVRDIAIGYGGEVFLGPVPDGYSTSFRFEVPAASAEELRDHQL